MLRSALTGVTVILATAISVSVANAQGLFLTGAGAKSRSFGGATTATPLDAAGGMYWNPATISQLPRNEMMFGGELIYTEAGLTSTIPAGAIGPFPMTTRTGRTRSDSGVAVLPTVAMVFRPAPESPWTFGLGLLAPAGGGVNFAGGSNPVLNPQNPPGGGNVAPFTFGFGPQAASVALFNLTPTVAYKVNHQLTIGATLFADIMTMSLDPAFFGPRNPNGTFPSATNGRPFWGGGFKIGALFSPNCDWDIGMAYHSPHWLETLEFNSADETGRPLTLRLPFTLPSIVTMGAAYKGIPNTILALDVRWFDYTNAKTLGDPVRVGGVRWDNIWAIAAGAQYKINDCFSVRAGYSFNENPIPQPATLFNTQLPGFFQHILGVGATMAVNQNLSLSLTYVVTFKNNINGTILQIPGTSVKSDIEMHSLAFSANVNF